MLDEIDGRQQGGPVQIAAEPQLQIVRFRKLVEVDRPVQREAASGRGRTDGDDRRLLALVNAAHEIRHPLRQLPELFRRFDAVERVGELARGSAYEPIARSLDNRGPCLGLTDT